ncbi:MAG: DUF4432 family protein [Planctomycetota bacterium]|nr:MAG: DUF4432 family protein [Planctomycetota bacterium]REJ92717.1 MAG: DUF4432 family protein [Planctomycetota bacterium]
MYEPCSQAYRESQHMVTKRWTLLDTSDDTYAGPLDIVPADIEGSTADFRVSLRTLRGGLRDGVDVLLVESGEVRVALLPTRGMGVWKAWHGEVELGWRSPVRGPVHPKFVPLRDPSGLGWLDGFDELIVRCGLESNGAPEFDEAGRLVYPLHGRIANLPARRVELSVDGESGEVTVTGVVDEVRFLFQKLRLTTTVVVSPERCGFAIEDRVENLSADPAGMQLLYHCNFGPPLLSDGSQVVLPVAEMTPRDDHAATGLTAWDTYAGPSPGMSEQVYFFDLHADADGHTQALLENNEAAIGASLHFNTRQLPCFSLWKNTQAVVDGYVTGLEPGTNYPNPRSHEDAHGRVVELAPGESRGFSLALEFHPDEAALVAARAAIAKLQAGGKPQIHPAPVPGWTA